MTKQTIRKGDIRQLAYYSHFYERLNKSQDCAGSTTIVPRGTTVHVLNTAHNATRILCAAQRDNTTVYGWVDADELENAPLFA